MEKKKIIGIFCGILYLPDDLVHEWDETALNEGIGGSETWAISVSSELSKLGFYVIMFADCEHHFSSDGVEYYSYKEFVSVCNKTRFDYFIVSRFASIVSNTINCDNIFIIAHDNYILEAYNLSDLKLHLVSKIITLSTFQEKRLLEEYEGLTRDRFIRSGNGIDWGLYSDVDTYEKKNKMVWSSDKSRGAKYLITKILPIVRREIPDFEIDVCSYADNCTDDYFNVEGVNLRGRLSKADLAKLQKESKIWIYPNHGHFEDGTKLGETFCITAVENAAAKNAIICAGKHAFSDTLSGYDGFVGDECFGFNEWLMDESRLDEFAEKLARQAIELLKNEDERARLANLAYKICQKYTWKNITEALIKTMGPEELKNYELDERIRRNMVFHFWLPENVDENYLHILRIHLRCLDLFRDNFTDIKYVLAYDVKNEDMIKAYERRLFGDGFIGNISFKVIENNPMLREAVTYYDEVISKLDSIDGITFFGHLKGATNFGNKNVKPENIEKWITFMYWMNMRDVKYVADILVRPHTITYGTFKFLAKDFTRNGWAYLGSFQWINTKKLYDYIGGRNPKSVDLGSAELFLGDYVTGNPDYSFSEKLLSFMYDSNPRCLYEEDIDAVISILLPDDGDRNEYYDFHNEILNYINNEK